MGRADDTKAMLDALGTNSVALLALHMGNRDDFCAEAREVARQYKVDLGPNTDVFRLISTWSTKASCPQSLKNALSDLRVQKKETRRKRTAFLTRTRLYVSPGLQIRMKAAIRTITVKTRVKGYPPYGTIIADTTTIYNLWYPHFVFGKQADSRLKRLPLDVLDKCQLQLDIGPHESVLLKDDRGQLLAFVIRNFCPDRSLLDWATAEANKQIPLRRNIRKEDTGKLVLMGYSAGSRSKTAFDWVKNITKKTTEAEKLESDAAGSVLFALAWQLMKSQIPQEVIDDFTDFVKDLRIRRMDRGTQERNSKTLVDISRAEENHGTLRVAVGKEEFEFDNVELAPPSGVVGRNYSRTLSAQIRAMHRERHPHKWAVSWTMYRTPAATGSDFFLANLGIRIQQASNTAIGWQPACSHGTSLPDCRPDEDDPTFRQIGVAFVTSNRLAGAWKKYQAGLITREEAEKEVIEEMDEAMGPEGDHFDE
ncbi:hypothetical protein H0H93_006531 [Arthromyces matolae]|nr:hypothetical protein H0H93_006531 [Arthromyces matolae]